MSPRVPAFKAPATGVAPAMTLRDYFAAAVLPQVYATSVVSGGDSQRDIAIEAYEIADAMLTARHAASPGGLS